MKTISSLFASLLCGVTMNAQAEGGFIGGAFGPATFPNFAKDANASMDIPGAPAGSSSETKQQAYGHSLEIYGGMWLNKHWGWEAGYTNFGSVDGHTTAVYPGFGTGTMTYRYAAKASHVAALFGMELARGSRYGGTLYGKLGLHSTQNKFTALTGGVFAGVTSVSHSNTGVLYGGGYAMPYTDHLVVRIELNNFALIKFADMTGNSINTTKTETITSLGFGMDYQF